MKKMMVCDYLDVVDDDDYRCYTTMLMVMMKKGKGDDEYGIYKTA